jgi:hydroxymethylbilane synthase
VNRLILGTRGSALALAQVDLTRAALGKAWPELPVEQRVFVTRGDQKLDLSLLRAGEAGGKGLFTKELEDALLAGAIDVAVHSLKDLPGHNPPGLEVAAVLERASTADLLITRGADTFAALENGARIGTSSVRRARQLQWLRPDLQIEEWRGNVQTRLRKLAQRVEVAGIVLAQAGLERLGYAPASGALEFEGTRFHIVSLREHLLPAIGQGAIALQARADRADVRTVLAAINHAPTFTCIRAEREVQRLLAGDCGLPVGVRATLNGETLRLSAILFSESSDQPARAEASGPAGAPEAVAAELFARLVPSSQAHAYEKI